MSFHAPEEFRVTQYSKPEDRNNGLFYINTPSSRNDLKIICSDGMGWEHVSVSKKYEAPTWDEMCKVKALFWDEEDCVIQFHPPKSDYVNNHPYCLHMWREIGREVSRPNKIMV